MMDQDVTLYLKPLELSFNNDNTKWITFLLLTFPNVRFIDVTMSDFNVVIRGLPETLGNQSFVSMLLYLLNHIIPKHDIQPNDETCSIIYDLYNMHAVDSKIIRSKSSLDL